MVIDPQHRFNAKRIDEKGEGTLSLLIWDPVSSDSSCMQHCLWQQTQSGFKKTTLSVHTSHFLIFHRSWFALNVNLWYKLCPSPKMFCCGLAVGLDPCLILQLWEQSLLSTQETGGQTSGSLYFFCQRKCLFSPVVWKRSRRGKKLEPATLVKTFPGRQLYQTRRNLIQRYPSKDETRVTNDNRAKRGFYILQNSLCQCSLCQKKNPSHWLGNKEPSSVDKSFFVF